MDLSAVRAELPVLERYAYLNAGTNGPLPRRSAEAMIQAVERDLAEGRSSKSYFERLLAQREELRGALGRILEAPGETIALATSTTEGCNVVLTGLGIGPGDEVVTSDSEHPGLFGGLLTSGAEVREVELSSRPAAEALEALEAAITPKTRLLALSHVSWLTGAVFPVRELAGRGIPVLVDGAQAAVVSHFKDIIYLPIETSGEGEVNAHSRVQMALGEAKNKAKREFADVRRNALLQAVA